MPRKPGDPCLARLREAVADAGLQRPDVSKWSVGMHVHHCALGMVAICRAVLDSSPPPPPSRFSAARAFVLASGRIPRGRADAPEAALPNPDIRPEELHGLLNQADGLIVRVGEAEPGQWWTHFAFGVLKRDEALRFIGIHNRHHLRIIADIRTASRRVSRMSRSGPDELR
jgi:hypothetical protein